MKPAAIAIEPRRPVEPPRLSIAEALRLAEQRPGSTVRGMYPIHRENVRKWHPSRGIVHIAGCRCQYALSEIRTMNVDAFLRTKATTPQRCCSYCLRELEFNGAQHFRSV